MAVEACDFYIPWRFTCNGILAALQLKTIKIRNIKNTVFISDLWSNTDYCTMCNVSDSKSKSQRRRCVRFSWRSLIEVFRQNEWYSNCMYLLFVTNTTKASNKKQMIQEWLANDAEGSLFSRLANFNDKEYFSQQAPPHWTKATDWNWRLFFI